VGVSDVRWYFQRWGQSTSGDPLCVGSCGRYAAIVNKSTEIEDGSAPSISLPYSFESFGLYARLGS